MHVTAEEGRQKSVQNGLDTLSACIHSLDSRLDKQRFLEYNHSAFMIPKKLEFQGQKSDEVRNGIVGLLGTIGNTNFCFSLPNQRSRTCSTEKWRVDSLSCNRG